MMTDQQKLEIESLRKEGRLREGDPHTAVGRPST